MGRVKDIRVMPITAKSANGLIKRWHYSGKVVKNSQLHLGVFLDNRCGGVMQFGPSLDKRKMLGLVEGTKWNGFLELNRMAFADWLPRNSESRALGYAFRWIRKTYPHIEWCVSFADGAQCGDGTIYRASGFVLTQIKKNTSIWEAPDQSDPALIGCSSQRTSGAEAIRRARFSRTSLTDQRSRKEQAKAYEVVRVSRTTVTKARHMNGAKGGATMRPFIEAGFRPVPGYQLRYIYFLDRTARERLTVPVLPFTEIERRGAGMYRGRPKTSAGSSSVEHHVSNAEVGGSIPTPALNAIPS